MIGFSRIFALAALVVLVAPVLAQAQTKSGPDGAAERLPSRVRPRPR